jgi:iron-sulfur cluster repair protein YtfE (RIC family)
MKPSEARALLLGQHAVLRDLMRVAEQAASRYLRGGAEAAEVDKAVADLRKAFAEHNRSEESLLLPMLRAGDAWGPQRIERMVEEHVEEHATFRALMEGSAAEVAPRMADLDEELDAHMEAEERTFLSAGVLRDDLVDLDSDG